MLSFIFLDKNLFFNLIESRMTFWSEKKFFSSHNLESFHVLTCYQQNISVLRFFTASWIAFFSIGYFHKLFYFNPFFISFSYFRWFFIPGLSSVKKNFIAVFFAIFPIRGLFFKSLSPPHPNIRFILLKEIVL